MYWPVFRIGVSSNIFYMNSFIEECASIYVCLCRSRDFVSLHQRAIPMLYLPYQIRMPTVASVITNASYQITLLDPLSVTEHLAFAS